MAGEKEGKTEIPNDKPVVPLLPLMLMGRPDEPKVGIKSDAEFGRKD